MGVERLGRLAERVARLERALVGVGDDRPGPELLVDPVDGRLHAPLVQPEHQAEREEVLGQVLLLAGHVEPVERALVERRDRDLEDGVGLERAVGQRIARVGRLVEVLLGERVAVDDQRAAGRQVADVGLERGRVHRHEDVRLVARRVDLGRREADLEARDPGQRAGRRPDLRREVGQGADVVAEDRGRPGELGPGQLHPVAGIAGEADGDALQFLDVRAELRVGGCHAPSGSFMRWLRPGWEVEQLLRERLGQVLDDVRLADDADEMARLVDERHVPVATGLHQDDRVADRLVQVQGARLGGHERLDRLAQVHLTADDPPEDVTLGQDAGEAAVGLADEDGIARPGPLDRSQAIGQRGARRDRHGLIAAEHPEAFIGDRWHAADDGGFGEFTHATSVSLRGVRPTGGGGWTGPATAADRRRRPAMMRGTRGRRLDRHAGRRRQAADGTPSRPRDRVGRGRRRELRVRVDLRHAQLRRGPGLADAARLAVRHRGRARLAVGRRVGVASPVHPAAVAPPAGRDPRRWGRCTRPTPRPTTRASRRSRRPSPASSSTSTRSSWRSCPFASRPACPAAGRGSRWCWR